MRVTFTISKAPVPKARPRYYNGHAVTPEKTRAYEAAVRRSYLSKGFPVFKGAISIDIVFYMPIPESKPKKVKEEMLKLKVRPDKKPDIDNLIKAILDGLNKVAWKDDSQIVAIRAVEYYSDTPRTEIGIKEVTYGETRIHGRNGTDGRNGTSGRNSEII